MNVDIEHINDAAEVLDTLTSRLPADHPVRLAAEDRAKASVAHLYGLAETIRALLAERDRLREALATARDYVVLALDQERDAYRGHEAVSDVTDMERDLAKIDATLAQEQGEKHDNQD